MDDNFSSIVKSVLWGRSVFTNIRKFLQFQVPARLPQPLTLYSTTAAARAPYSPWIATHSLVSLSVAHGLLVFASAGR
jgi:magnesium-transporting ATPase (P-type)